MLFLFETLLLLYYCMLRDGSIRCVNNNVVFLMPLLLLMLSAQHMLKEVMGKTWLNLACSRANFILGSGALSVDTVSTTVYISKVSLAVICS